MRFKFGIVLIPAFVFITCLAVYAEQMQPILEGMKPYIPTRLEWLALELNAVYRTDMNELEGYMLSFIPIEKENTILIYVFYNHQTRRELMNRGIDHARKIVEKEAKSRGWDSWLKIKEEIKLSDKDK